MTDKQILFHTEAFAETGTGEDGKMKQLKKNTPMLNPT